jgi:beta-glucanase (GH16 family)
LVHHLTGFRWDKLQGVYPNVSDGRAPIDFSLDYHIFSLEWDSSSIRWFVDENLVFARTPGQPSSLFLPPAPMYLILNSAVAYWFKELPEWKDEVFFRIDYVRIFERRSA